MDWGITLNVRDSLRDVVRKSIIADSGGLEYIWIADFPSTKYAPAVASMVGHVTETSRIGIGLMSVFLYDTDAIVRAISSLIDRYGERFDLLLGPGDRRGLNRCGVSFGQTSTIVDRVTSFSQRVKRGLEDAGHECPVWLGAQGPKMIEASKGLDGVLLNYADPDMIRWSLEVLSERPIDFRVGVFPPMLISREMRERDVYSFFHSATVVFIGLVQSVARKFDLWEALKGTRAKMRAEGFNLALVDSVGPSILDRFGVRTTPEGMSEYSRLIESLGISLIVSGPPQGLHEKLVEEFIQSKHLCGQNHAM